MADIKRIELSIRDEITGDITGPFVIILGRHELLCAVLENIQPLLYWFNVRSVNRHTSPHLNYFPQGRDADETRTMVNLWGERLWSPPNNREHRLTLTLDPPEWVVSAARRRLPSVNPPGRRA